MIREFLEKIYVYQSGRIDGQKIHFIRIAWICIGEFSLSTTITDIEKSA
ncbi:MAG: DUF4368 domain-containing protein [Faecalispora jeddahensis]